MPEEPHMEYCNLGLKMLNFSFASRQSCVSVHKNISSMCVCVCVRGGGVRCVLLKAKCKSYKRKHIS